jgi:hypothetical protein
MLFHIHKIESQYPKPNVSDVTLRLVLNIDIQESVGLEKMKNVLTFINYCWEFESCKSGFLLYNRTLNSVCNAFRNEDCNGTELQY